MKRNFYGTAQRKLALAGERHRIFRNDAGCERYLDTSTLWVRKDKSAGEGVGVSTGSIEDVGCLEGGPIFFL